MGIIMSVALCQQIILLMHSSQHCCYSYISMPNFLFPSYLHNFWHIYFVFLILSLLHGNCVSSDTISWNLVSYSKFLTFELYLLFSSACTVCLNLLDSSWAFANICLYCQALVLKQVDILISNLKLCLGSLLLFFSHPSLPSLPEVEFIF